MCFWKQWKKIKTKHDNLVKLRMKDNEAWKYANTRKGYWRISNSQILNKTLTNAYLEKLCLGKARGYLDVVESFWYSS